MENMDQVKIMKGKNDLQRIISFAHETRKEPQPLPNTDFNVREIQLSFASDSQLLTSCIFTHLVNLLFQRYQF